MADTQTKSRKAPKPRNGAALKPPPFQPVQFATLVDSVPTGDPGCTR